MATIKKTLTRGDVLIVQRGSNRAKLYPEGGWAMEYYVEGIGWCLPDSQDDLDPDGAWEATVDAIRAAGVK